MPDLPNGVGRLLLRVPRPGIDLVSSRIGILVDRLARRGNDGVGRGSVCVADRHGVTA